MARSGIQRKEAVRRLRCYCVRLCCLVTCSSRKRPSTPCSRAPSPMCSPNSTSVSTSSRNSNVLIQKSSRVTWSASQRFALTNTQPSSSVNITDRQSTNNSSYGSSCGCRPTLIYLSFFLLCVYARNVLLCMYSSFVVIVTIFGE